MYHNKIHVARSREEIADTHISDLPVSTVYYPDDEIGLLDIWLVLVKRRILIFAVFTLCVVAGMVMLMITKPVYQSRAVLEIGKVIVVGLIEPRDSLAQRVREDYRVDDTSEGPREFPIVDSVGNEKNAAGNTLTITTKAYDAEKAQAYLWQVTSKIIEAHKSTYEKSLQETKKQIDYVEAQYKAYQAQVDQLSRSVKALEKHDAAQAALLTLEKAKLIAQQPDLVDKRIKLSMSMVEPQSKPTRLVRNPTLPIQPIEPKKTLFLILSVIAGIVLAVFVAFIAEFLGKAREQLRIMRREETAP